MKAVGHVCVPSRKLQPRESHKLLLLATFSRGGHHGSVSVCVCAAPAVARVLQTSVRAAVSEPYSNLKACCGCSCHCPLVASNCPRAIPHAPRPTRLGGCQHEEQALAPAHPLPECRTNTCWPRVKTCLSLPIRLPVRMRTLPGGAMLRLSGCVLFPSTFYSPSPAICAALRRSPSFPHSRLLFFVQALADRSCPANAALAGLLLS